MPHCTRCLWVLIACGFFSASSTAAERPNVVFVLADDLGYGDVKCFGGRRCQIDTPHFDRLAAEGMRFTNAHANASVCVPTRVAIMSGRYAWRFGRAEPGGPWGFLGLQFATQQSTLATILKSVGYRTAYVGKWHLGTRMHTKDDRPQGHDNVDFTQPLHVGPPQFGFDESFILPGSLDMYPYAFVHNNAWVGQVTAKKGWSAFHRVGPAAEDFEDVKVLSTFGDRAVDLLQTFASEGQQQPFFLYLALTAPHTPTSPSEAFQGRSKLGIYGDFVMETDHILGRVLNALDELKLSDNTLVIATSDHGPALYAGRIAAATNNQLRTLEKDGHYSSGPHRGDKFSAYEGGLRVPFVARLPSIVRPQSSCDQLIGLQDLYATVAEFSGAKPDDVECPDSISFAPLLRDPRQPGQRTSMILQATNAFAMIDDRWKLLFCPGSGCLGRYGNRPPSQQAWRQARTQFGRAPRDHQELLQAPFIQLYDLSRDPAEARNLAEERPEQVQRLAAQARQIIDRGRSTDGESLPNNRANIGLFRSVPEFVWE